MKVKLVALYDKPEDETAFLQHYKNVHMPLVAQTPGLERAVVNRVTADAMGGAPAYFMIAEMHYPDRVTFDTAMKSPENRAAGKDLMTFAKGKVKLLIVEEH